MSDLGDGHAPSLPAPVRVSGSPVVLPQNEGDEAPKGATWYQCRSMLSGSPDIRGRGNAFRRSIVAISVPGTVLPGKGADLRSPLIPTVSRRSPMPRPASMSGRPP